MFSPPSLCFLPDVSLCSFPRLQLHCYKQSSHCALLLCGERRIEKRERAAQGMKTNEGERRDWALREVGILRQRQRQVEGANKRVCMCVCSVGQMLPL